MPIRPSPVAAVALLTVALLPLSAVGAPSTPQLQPAAGSPEAQSEAPRPHWVVGHGLSTAGEKLLEALEGAGDHGLDPADYAADHIRSLLDQGDMTAAQDLLDAAFLRYAGDLVGGRGYVLPAPRDLLMAAAWSPAPQDFLSTLAPVQAAYARLKAALADLNAIAASGGWPDVPDGPTLRVGDQGPAVTLLRQRLNLSGDLAEEGQGDVFDDTLLAAVERFQARHGLAADGVVGPATRAALNVTAAERARQVAVNLERLRRAPPLPDTSGLRVEVNVPAYDLAVREKTETLMRMKVAVGRPDRATPVMRHAISSLVFNPHWYVPRSIVVQDLLPREEANPGTLEREGFEVIAEGDPPRLRQKPGPDNALGRIKFNFPNSDAIYLHDTNAPQVFQASQRAVSWGCVRVEQPADLAALLLEATETASADLVAERLDAGQPRSIKLREPVPIDIAYRTAWVEPDGTLHFREDIYGMDRAVAVRLGAPRPPLVDSPVVALD